MATNRVPTQTPFNGTPTSDRLTERESRCCPDRGFEPRQLWLADKQLSSKHRSHVWQLLLDAYQSSLSLRSIAKKIIYTQRYVHLLLSRPVCLSACLSACLSVSVCLCVSLCFCLRICLRVCLLVCLCLSVCVSVCVRLCVCLCLSVCLSVSRVSVNTQIDVFIHPQIPKRPNISVQSQLVMSYIQNSRPECKYIRPITEPLSVSFILPACLSV